VHEQDDSSQLHAMEPKLATLLLFILFAKNASQQKVGDAQSVNEIAKDGSGRIVGGQIMQIESAPYMVSIFYKTNHLCGGSIISRQWIASAAHVK
jgi:secreted trypsin-like serine protease